VEDKYTIIEHFINWMVAYKKLQPDEVDGIYYPKKNQIKSLHKYLIENFRYEHETDINYGILYDAPLDFILIKYYQKKKIENKYEDLIYKGAHIFNSFLEGGHPFIDGNKRTGFVTLWIFLTINNFNIKFEYFDFNMHLKKFKIGHSSDSSLNYLNPFN
jgi:prophage maintenance system killer protein